MFLFLCPSMTLGWSNSTLWDINSSAVPVRAHNIYFSIATTTRRIRVYFIHLCRISMTFLPPRCSTSLPMCNNGFYSSSSKKKSHTGQREGQHLTELFCLLQQLLLKCFRLPTATRLGWEVVLPRKGGIHRNVGSHSQPSALPVHHWTAGVL